MVRIPRYLFSGRVVRTSRFLATAVCALALLVACPARAASIVVSTTADDDTVNGNCTLREAVRSANADAAIDACASGSGADVITVPAGSYTLAIAGRNENAAATGDLDLTGDVEIAGAGTGDTVVDGADLDRIFHVLPGVVALVRDLTIRGGMLDSSGPSYTGGGLLTAGATTTVERCTVEDNSSNYGGGGVGGIDGSLTIRDSTIRANHCNFGSGQVGCGIIWQGFDAADATMLVEGSTITGNYNEYAYGFAVYVNSWGDGDTIATLRNTTVSANLGGTFLPSSSGGIYVEDAAGAGSGVARAYLGNTTIVGNTDVGAHAFANVTADARVDLTSSILADNATYDCEGNVHSLGYNVVGDAVPPFNMTGRDCMFTAEGDQVVADPMLASLADNGGPTETQALLAGSPAIDAGHPAAPGSSPEACEALDQRGVARFRCDAGAYDEGGASFCPPSPQSGCRAVTGVTFLLRDKNADGPGDGDKLQWKWREAALTQVSDFGDPTVTTGYTVCAYDGLEPALTAGAELPAAATCDGEDCWRATGDRGFAFGDRSTGFDGVRSLKLKADDDPGSAKVVLKGLGAGLVYGGLPLAVDVTVQLLRSDSPVCWESIHTSGTVLDSSDEVFRSKVP